MKNYRSDEVETADVPTGQLRVDPHGSGWFLVQIGRGRYVKRFNISDAEARQLIEALERILPGVALRSCRSGQHVSADTSGPGTPA